MAQGFAPPIPLSRTAVVRPTALVQSFVAETSTNSSAKSALDRFNTGTLSPDHLMDVPSDSISELTRIEVGPFQSYKDMSHAELVLSQFGPVTVWQSKESRLMLLLTTVQQSTDQARKAISGLQLR